MPAPGFIPLSDPGGTVPSSLGGGSVTVNGKTGTNITLVPSDLGAEVAGAGASASSKALAFTIALGM